MIIFYEFESEKEIFPFYSIDKEKICMYSFETYQSDSFAFVAQ